MPYEASFSASERILRDHGGRPHWGKRHTQRAEMLAPLSPECDRFQSVWAALPTGSFRNAELDRVLG